MAQSATLGSGVTGTSAIILDPTAKTTTVGVSVSGGTSNASVTVEMTLDDPTAVPLGGPSVAWFTLSSGVAMASSAFTNLVYTVLSPIGGVRLNSTQNSSLASFTLRALQSETA